MPKSSQAFRTISEVADELEIQKHVLRFWESKFTQLKPMKRGGGRRYYRPEDVELLRGIHHLLRSQSYTIKGVQRILREQGVDFVKACWQTGRGLPAAGAVAGKVPAVGKQRVAASAVLEAGPPPSKSRAGAAAERSGPLAGQDVKAIKSAVDQLQEARAALTKTRKPAAEPARKPAAERQKVVAPKRRAAAKGS